MNRELYPFQGAKEAKNNESQNTNGESEMISETKMNDFDNFPNCEFQ